MLRNNYLNAKVIAAVLLIIGISFYLFYSIFREFQETRLSEIKQEYYNKITHSFTQNHTTNLKNHYEKEVDAFLDETMIELVAQKRRDEFLKYTLKAYKELLKKDSYISIVHIHNADGTTFVRLHKPSFYDDNIAQKRELLQKIHKEKKRLSTFELGVSGFYFRSIVPLFYKGEYVGAFELGISPQKLLDFVSKFNHVEGVIKLEDASHREAFFTTKNISKYENFLGKIDENLPKESLLYANGEYIALYSYDVLGINDKKIGKFVFFQDLSRYYNYHAEVLNKTIYIFLLMGAMLFLLLSYLLYFSTKRAANLKNRATLMLNAQENIVVITEVGAKLKEVNRVFLEFSGFENLKKFHEKYECICDLFVAEEGYLQKMVDGKNWVEYIILNPNKTHLAKIPRQDAQMHSFRVHANPLHNDSALKEYVITFEDITQELRVQKALEFERDLFSDGPVITIEWEPTEHWPVRYVSKNVTKELGFTPEEMMHEEFVYAELIHPDDLAQVFEEVSAYIESKTPTYEQSYRLRHKSGEYKWFYDFTNLIFDENAELISIRGYMFDQSEMKKTEEFIAQQKERLQNIIEGTNVGTWEWNIQTGETIFNDKWAQIIGYALEEISPTTIETWMKFANADDLKASEESLNDCISGKSEFYEAKCRMKHRDGSEIWVYDRGKVSKWDKDGNALVMSGTHTNIDSEVKAQEELVKLNKNLQKANEAKSQFLANMSHEIRTPMNAILGLSELLKDTNLDAKQLDFLEKIYGSSKMLLGIINDILDFSKLEAGKLELENKPFKVESIFAQLRVLFSTKSAHKGLELYFHKQKGLPSVVVGDELRLEQVVTNLLSNALKFTHEGTVIFSMKLKEKIDESNAIIEVSILDNGIGISKEEQKRLFLPFSQADSSTTRKFGGTGLGLMISSKIVEAMGSKIELDSEVGVGSHFYFDLACEVVSWNEPDIQSLEKNYKVLIADDQEISREILADMLDGFGCSYDEACDGEEAIKKVLDADSKGEPYDFMLIDWVMPNLDGKEATKRLCQMHKAGELHYKIPSIMMVSAHLEEEVGLEDVDVNGFLPKPVTSSTLLDALMSAKEGFVRPIVEREKEESISFDGVCVLVVEDNEINQEVATLMLERVGIKVMVAHNGAEGVSIYLANREKIDLILMDLQMPVMSGYEATQEIRQEDKEVPILALTAAAMVEDREKVLSSGMNDHLAKPIDTVELYRKLSFYLNTQMLLEASVIDNVKSENEILNEEYLENTLSSEALIEKLLKKFLKQLNEEFSTICEVIQTDKQTAARMVHTLKGVSANLGAQRVAQTSKKIDELLKMQEQIPQELVEQFQEDIDALKELLQKRAFSHEKLSSGIKLEESFFKEFLATILKKLGENSILSKEELNTLLSNAKEKFATDAYLGLELALEELEFESAIEILESYIKNSQER